MSTEPDAIIPLEQQTIPFYEQPLVVLRLADERIVVVLRWLCTNLKLDPQAQLRRIKRTKAIADEVISALVQTEGGVQVMPARSLRALPFWLAGIDTRRLDPTIEPVILVYQREVVDGLYQHFAQQRLPLAEPHPLVPSEPMVQPDMPGHDASPDVWLAYHEQMVVWLAGSTRSRPGEEKWTPGKAASSTGSNTSRRWRAWFQRFWSAWDRRRSHLRISAPSRRV